MQFFKNSRKLNSKKITGQGMSEYLIIVGLVAVAGIAVMGLMGNTVRNQFGGMAQELGGTSGTAAVTSAGAAGDKAADVGNTQKNLSDYAGQNALLK